MEFGKHLDKGVWGFLDKSLPSVYGIAFIFLVIRTMPTEEYGSYFLIQSVYAMVAALSFSLIVQPMVVYLAEGADARQISATALAMLVIFFAVVSILVIALKSSIIWLLDKNGSGHLDVVVWYLPAMFFISLYRTIASGILQAFLRTKDLFIVDFVYFLLSFIMVIAVRRMEIVLTAPIVLNIWLACTVAASVVAYALVRRTIRITIGWHHPEAIRIFRYGRFAVGGTVGSIAQSQLDTFFISAYGGVVGVAAYGVAKTFIRVFDLFTQVIQLLVLPVSSKLHGKGEYGRLRVVIEKSICFSMVAILPCIIIFELFPDVLFHLVYGSRYTEGIPLLRIMAIIGLIIPAGSVVASVILGIGRTNISFFMSLGSVVLSVAVYVTGGSIAGIIGIAWGVVVQYFVLGIIGFIILKRIIPFSTIAIIGRLRDIMEYLQRRIFLRHAQS